MATHSPVMLGAAEPAQVLCFAKTGDGAVDIVRGTDHPALADLNGGKNLGALFADGSLG